LGGSAEMAVGRTGNTNLLAFNPSLVNATPPPTLWISGLTNSRMTSLYSVGGVVNLVAPCVGTNDLRGGIINILADQVQIGRSGSAGNQALGVLTFDDGTFDANTVTCGLQATNGGAAAVGIINIKTNTVLGANGTLVVNSVLNLGFANTVAATGTAGTLNVDGGTVHASLITAGLGTSSIIVANGGLLDVTNTIGLTNA